MPASEWQTLWPSMSQPNEKQNDGVKFQLSCERLLNGMQKKQQPLFNTNGPFHLHQILAEGCQCSTSPHCRAPGNQWAWTMTQHHLVNRQLSQYSSMMTMHNAHLTSELTHTVLWILRHLLKVFMQCLGWTPKQPGDGSHLSLTCKSDALFTF